MKLKEEWGISIQDGHGVVRTKATETWPNGLVRTSDSLHTCEMDLPSKSYGPAIDFCYENEHGELWAGNGEYGSQVLFCPFCGFKAPNQKFSKGYSRSGVRIE